MRGVLRAGPPRRVAWALVKMSRPSHLLLIVAVYALGTAIALARGVAFAGDDFAWGLLALLLVSASVHYANEYADHETDARTERTPFSGGSGALQATGLPRALALVAAWATLLSGVAVALACILHGFPRPAIVALVAGGLLGWQYSLPPLALAWRGWGELDNAALGGLLLPLYGFAVQAGRIDFQVVLAAVPFFALVFANLLDTTWPDRAADAAVGKRTLATRWPPRRLRGLYLASAAAWLGSLVLLSGRVLPPAVAGASLVAAPFVAWGALAYTRSRSPFPTVAAMVLTAVVQLAAWGWVGYR